jgi:hypothetical protein
MAFRSNPFQAALADLKRIRERRAEIKVTRAALDDEDAALAVSESELDGAMRVMSRYGAAASIAPHLVSSAEPPAEPPAPASGQKTQSTPEPEVMRTARRMLIEHGDMHKDDLYVKVFSAGVRLNGDFPLRYFGTILSRNKAAYGLDVSRKRGWFVENHNMQLAEPVNSSRAEPTDEEIEEMLK